MFNGKNWQNITLEQQQAFDDIRYMNRFSFNFWNIGGLYATTFIKTAYVYSDKLLQYRFHDQHPFNQMRLKLTTELLLNANLLSPEQIVQPRIATDDELMLIHKYDYVEAIKHASHGIISEDEGYEIWIK